MRIAFVTPEFVSEKYFGGGLANYVYRVGLALVEQGHEVHVMTLSIEDEDVDFDGLRLHRVNLGRKQSVLNAATLSRLWQTSKWITFSLNVCRRLAALHRAHPFDVVQFANCQACGLFSILLLDLPCITRASSFRPLWNRTAGIRRNMDVRLLEWLETQQVRKCPYVFAPSSLIQNVLISEAGVGNVEKIGTPFFRECRALDPSVYKSSVGQSPYLLFFGRFQVHKGFQVLADALPTVFEALPDFRCVMVGADRPSPFAASMRAYAEKMCAGFDEQLVFIDELRHAQLYPVIQHARLVVLPSLVDNLPNALLEAMSFGRQVIGTTGTSFDEILTDGENGFLVPPGDPKALADKIVEAWNHPRLEEIGKAAAKKATEFAPERTVTELVRYYEDVVIGH